MAKLILIKHSLPEIAPDVPSNRWVLSAEGGERCAWLSDELARHSVRRLYSSLEPKALETAARVAVRLGLEVRSRADLQENDRTGLGFLSNPALRERVRRFFQEPAALVMGTETAEAALARFERAVRAIAAEARDEATAVVTHGTVITLLVSRYNTVAPFDFWSSLTLPSYAVLDAASFALDGAALGFSP